jgi:cytochrome c553
MRILILLSLSLTFNVMALSPEAQQGKVAIAACLACHNAELKPALAPPLYGVQNRYKRAYADKQGFVQAISDWAKQPTQEKALMKRPIKKLGLMPAMPLPDDTLAAIGAYLYEQEFAPPCTHWANELKNSSVSPSQGQGKGRGQGKGMGQGGNHDAMIRMKYNQLCK